MSVQQVLKGRDTDDPDKRAIDKTTVERILSDGLYTRVEKNKFGKDMGDASRENIETYLLDRQTPSGTIKRKDGDWRQQITLHPDRFPDVPLLVVHLDTTQIRVDGDA